MGCFSGILFACVFVFMMVTFIRWFEHTADAVDRRAWRELVMLVVMPFSVWMLRSRVAAGRPTAVPLHEPVRGFGSVGTGKSAPPLREDGPTEVGPPGAASAQPHDQPPPGTPKEFLELPKPTVGKPRAGVDPDAVERLRKKMRDQGMLPPE
jgi:hypothetical protein